MGWHDSVERGLIQRLMGSCVSSRITTDGTIRMEWRRDDRRSMAVHGVRLTESDMSSNRLNSPKFSAASRLSSAIDAQLSRWPIDLPSVCSPAAHNWKLSANLALVSVSANAP